MKKSLVCALFLCAIMSAAEPAKKDVAPTITSEDREPLLEAEKVMKDDQVQVLLGQAANLRLKTEQETFNEIVRTLTAKCAGYPLVRDDKGRAQCGAVKESAPAPGPPANPDHKAPETAAAPKK